MRIPRVPLSSSSERSRILPAETVHYLMHVLRLRPGDRFLAFDPQSGMQTEGCVTDTLGRVELEGWRRADPPTWEVTLLYALAKGDKCDTVVRGATELAASNLVLFVGQRSEVHLTEERAHTRLVRFQKIADEAARQSGRTRAPSLAFKRSFREALSPVTAAHRYLFHPGASAEFSERCLHDMKRGILDVCLAIGPEGGFEREEIEEAQNAGFSPVRFGEHILRTETAPLAALSAYLAVRAITGARLESAGAEPPEPGRPT